MKCLCVILCPVGSRVFAKIAVKRNENCHITYPKCHYVIICIITALSLKDLGLKPEDVIHTIIFICISKSRLAMGKYIGTGVLHCDMESEMRTLMKKVGLIL